MLGSQISLCLSSRFDHSCLSKPSSSIALEEYSRRLSSGSSWTALGSFRSSLPLLWLGQPYEQTSYGPIRWSAQERTREIKNRAVQWELDDRRSNDRRLSQLRTNWEGVRRLGSYFTSTEDPLSYWFLFHRDQNRPTTYQSGTISVSHSGPIIRYIIALQES